MNKNLITLAMVLALGACGSSDDKSSAATFGGISEMTIDASATNYTDGATSNLVVFDDDSGEKAFTVQTDTETTYGLFSITADGTWTYRLVDSNNQVAVTPVGDVLTDSITVSSVDGTQTTVTISINGTYVESVATFSGDVSGLISYDATSALTGTLTIADDNAGEDKAVVQTDAPTTYGTFSINSSGDWTYTLDTANNAVSGLADDADITDTINVSSIDGTTTSIVITINGPVVGNKEAIFTGDVTANIANTVTSDITGDITVTDLNPGESSIEVQTDFLSLYGSFSIDASGSWTYSLDDSNATVAGLATESDTVVDTISIESADGTIFNVEITITGPVSDDKVVVITDEDDTDSGEVRLSLDDTDLGIESVLRGKFTTSFKKSATIESTSGEDVEASITLNGASNASNNALLELLITGDTYEIVGSDMVIDIPVVEDEWVDVEITWDSTNADFGTSVYPLITVSINGVSVSEEPFDSTSAKLGQVDEGMETFKFKLGGSNGEVVENGYFMVDDIGIYSTEDVDGVAVDTLVWAENFESYTVGEALPDEDDTSNPTAYNGNTEFAEIQLVVGNGKTLP